jgi:EAL domain-containing protein (putative c-di-GMP-specific phosphodiesterase class I)
MNAEANERTRIDRELRHALQHDELILHYQPVLDLRSGRLDGVEALVRWQHPQRGLLGPGSFITVAEESGLIEALGAWVLERSCEQMARWREEHLGVTHVSVNVSSRQLQRADFFARVRQALERNHLPPAALVVEVTESLFTDEAAVQVLRSLQDLGVRVAVDDFGTGYSSFAYLRTLPISIVKLDRTFIVDVETSSAAATIAAAIIKMAHALGKRVVAEGVESDGQVTFLERAGCESVQGFIVSRPVEATALAKFLLSYERAGKPPAAPVTEAAHTA